MNAFLEAVQHYLRGPAVSRVLRRFGIDPHRYWLLVDLFGELTDRREMLGHLGRDGVGLKMIAAYVEQMKPIPSCIVESVCTELELYQQPFLISPGWAS